MSTIPLGRGSTPVDVANACCYLASDEAKFITGVDLQVGDIFLIHPQFSAPLLVMRLAITDSPIFRSMGVDVCNRRTFQQIYASGEEEKPECVHPKQDDCLMAKAGRINYP